MRTFFGPTNLELRTTNYLSHDILKEREIFQITTINVKSWLNMSLNDKNNDFHYIKITLWC